MATLSAMPKYESYKDSGEEWMGKIPSGWELVPIRSIFKFRNEKNRPIKTEEILSLSIANGVTKYSEKGRGGNKRKDDLSAYKIAYPNDIVLNSMNVIVGAVGMSKFYGAISPVYYALYTEKEDACIEYYEKIFLNVGFQRGLLKFGKGILIKLSGTGKLNTIRMKVSTDDLKTLYFPKPPFEVQKSIFEFLDNKTAQIDEAIAIKEKQIDLLKERKQIIIQKAVTLGLNPKVSMKDSGVDWIGQIPEHWSLKRLKYATKIVKRIIGYEGPDVLSITQRGIKIKDIESGEGQLAMNYSKYQVVNVGDFAMNHMDLLTGYVDISKFEGVTSPDYRVFVNILKELNNDFLLSIFQLGYQQKVFYRYGQGVSLLGRWRFPAENFNNFFIPIPPIEEQIKIVEHVQQQWAKVDTSIDLIKKQIEKLKEYKTTLINSAVTGKIKVT